MDKSMQARGTLVFLRSKITFSEHVRKDDVQAVADTDRDDFLLDADTVVLPLPHSRKPDTTKAIFGDISPPSWLDFFEAVDVGSRVTAMPEWTREPWYDEEDYEIIP